MIPFSYSIFDFFAQKVKHTEIYRKAESRAVTRVRMIRFVESFKQMFKVGRINFRGIADNKLIAILFRYFEIGRRIARRRKDLGLKQTEVCERAGINDKYLSCIERAASIPSLDVVMRLSFALDCTPDEFLVGSVKYDDEQWRDVAGLLRNMNIKKLDLAKSFLLWLNDQEI